ncbi:MAG: hypothetical protein M1127_02755 [Patescibacteria group bacterium]|nr:hypothetical protein [Patescibacteria group bacterium]
MIFLAVFLAVTAGAVLYFYNFAYAKVAIGLDITGVSFSLDSTDSHFVRYKATVKNTSIYSSDKDAYNSEKIERKVYFTVLETEVCSVVLPVIGPGQTTSVECASDYVPPASNSQLKIGVNDKYTNPFTTYDIIKPMYPVLEASFTQFPPYYNPNDKLNPAQVFAVNVKNTGFPIRNDIAGNFSFRYLVASFCNTGDNAKLFYSQVNSPEGQNVSCAITPTNNNPYNIIFYSANPYLYVASPTINTGAPDLMVSQIYCGERLNPGSPIACSISIANISQPIAQNSLSRGLVVDASFLDANRQAVGTGSKEVCFFDFSKTDISTLNAGGGVLAKQCVVASTNIPAGAMYVNTTAKADPDGAIKESNEANNTSQAKEVSFQGQDATQTVNLYVQVEPAVSLAGVKFLFQDIGGVLRAICLGNACSVSLPSGEYRVLPADTFIDCSAPDCPLQFRVVDRAVDLELKIKSITPAANFCADSDANEDNPYFVKGAVRSYSTNSRTFSGNADSCSGAVLREYSCSSTSSSFVSFTCPNGCYDGACLQNCAALSGLADLQCKSLAEMEVFKEQCPDKEVVYDQLRVGQYCSNTGGNYCVQCKPECETDVDCKTHACAAGEEPFCSGQKCACRKSLPDLTVTTALACPKTSYNTGETISGCSITIKNQGIAATAIAPKTNLYSVAGSSWKLLSRIIQPAVLGQNGLSAVTFGGFSFTAPGAYNIRACVDDDPKEIAETNENNNCSDVLAVQAKVQAADCVSLYGTGWWCGTEKDRAGQCGSGIGSLQPLGGGQTCDKNAAIASCVTCALTKCSANAVSVCPGFPCPVNQVPRCVDAQCACENVTAPPQAVDCQKEYGIGWWCGDYSDWKGQCYNEGTYRELTSQVCSQKGAKYCATCGVKTFFSVVGKAGGGIGGIKVSLSPMNATSSGLSVGKAGCTTDAQGFCSVVLIPYVRYSVGAEDPANSYKCADCASGSFAARLDDYTHTLVMEEQAVPPAVVFFKAVDEDKYPVPGARVDIFLMGNGAYQNTAAFNCKTSPEGVCSVSLKSGVSFKYSAVAPEGYECQNTTSCFGEGKAAEAGGILSYHNLYFASKAQVSLFDCRREYGAGWWCASRSAWRDQCGGEGNFLELNDQFCDKKENDYCATCGVKTFFRAMTGNQQAAAGVEVSLKPVNFAAELGRALATETCATDKTGTCFVYLIPGARYSVAAQDKHGVYSCSNCANSGFTARLDDAAHVLTVASNAVVPLPATTTPTSAPPVAIKCTDSDKGRNYLLFGAAEGLGADDSKIGVFSDYCDPADSFTLYEYYCFDTTAAKEEVKCGYGCENGACKKPPASDNGAVIKPEQKSELTIGGAKLEIPAEAINSREGAVAYAVPVSVNSASVAKEVSVMSGMGKKIVGGMVFDFSVVANSGEEIHTFDKPVTITLQYDKADVKNEDRLVIYIFNETTNMWEALPTKVDKENHTLTAQTSHFTDVLTAEDYEGNPCCAASDCSSPPLNLICKGMATDGSCNLQTEKGVGWCQNPNEVTFGPYVSKSGGSMGTGEKGIMGVVARVGDVAFWLGLIIAPLFILLGAFWYVSAAGDETKAKNGKKIIMWALAGLAICLCARFVNGIVHYFLGVG